MLFEETQRKAIKHFIFFHRENKTNPHSEPFSEMVKKWGFLMFILHFQGTINHLLVIVFSVYLIKEKENIKID